MIIVLDAGHGAGEDYNRGSLIGNEGDNNFAFSLVLKKELEKLKGVTVKLTRQKITDNPSLQARGEMGRGYDLFLSLHSNAADHASVRGVEIWEDVDTDDGGLADKLCKALAPFFGDKNRGVKHRAQSDGRDWYGVLRASGAKSSMLIEHGFHTNLEDCKVYTEQRAALARAESIVIAQHYGLETAIKSEVVAPTAAAGEAVPTVTQQKVDAVTTYEEHGRFYPEYTMNVRARPSTDAKIVAQYPAGSVIPSERSKYDQVTIANGYVWISYIARSGLRRYVAARPVDKPRGFWGPCKAE